MASFLLPLGASILGKLLGNGVETGGRRHLVSTKKAFDNHTWYEEMGGRRCDGGRVHRVRGRGFLKNVLGTALKFGKKLWGIARNKQVQGLVKHGINVYKGYNKGKQAKRAKETATAAAEGSGRRRRRRNQIRMKNVRGRQGRGMLLNASSNSSGPLP